MTGLPLPNLDDRRFDDLVEQARALIPFHAPEWTDHNAHDPGMTVLELLAWVTEMDLFRINQVTDVHRRKLLALAGVVPEPPRPAGTIAALRLAPGAAPLSLPAGLELTALDPSGGPVPLRTRHDVTVLPGGLAAVLTGAGDGALRDLTTSWARGEPILPFGPDPGPGAAVYLGFALPGPWPDGTLLGIGAGTGDGRSGPDAHHHIHHDAVLRWELLTGPGRWAALPSDAVDDGTRALTRDGRVVLRVPGGLVARPLPPAGRMTWLRARLARGAFDAPPLLRALRDNAVEVQQAVPAETVLRLAGTAQVSGPVPAPGERVDLALDLDRAGDVVRLRFAPPAPGGTGTAAVRVLAFDRPGRTLRLEAAAVVRGTGAAAQRVEVPGAPLLVPSVSVAGREGGAWRKWWVRPDLDASGRADAHVVVDPTAGTVTAGDGEHGRTVPEGVPLRVTADLTRGAAGNVAAGVIAPADSARNRAVVDLDAVAAALASAATILPATGGADAETVAAAVARAQEERERPARAVTERDHVLLAFATPGVRLARAEARANLHPAFGCQRAPGVVTVLVLPFLPADRPDPSPGLRRAVAAHLNRRRVIGTRIVVTGPVWVTVTVRATVVALPGARPERVVVDVREALDRYLHPLHGGPDGTGWPWGRDVHRSEVLAVVDGVTGVDHVAALDLVDADGDGDASCADVCLGPTGLVDPGPHEIAVR